LNKELLIVGIDPGTTIGYAILDLNGNIKKIKSKKGLTLSSLIFEVIKEGKILIVGCDVNPVPSFVKEFCRRTGAKSIYPDQDLLVKEKRKLAKDLTSNRHERDAYVSALLAYKKIRPLLDKVDLFVKRKNKEEYLDIVRERILKEKSNNINNALVYLENKKTNLLDNQS
jgi:hypothetical protein